MWDIRVTRWTTPDERTKLLSQVVENDTVGTRPVTLGLAEADMIELRGGVSEGALVVAKSGTFLRNGDRVRPVILPRTVADGR